MAEEREHEAAETNRQYLIAAINPILYQHLYGEAEDDDSNIEWISPSSPEEVDELLRLISEDHAGAEPG